MPLTAYLYDAKETDGTVELTPELVGTVTTQQILWVDLSAPDENDLQHIRALFGLNSETLEMCKDTSRRPALDTFTGYFQVHVNAIQEVNQYYKMVGLDFIVGPEYVITVHAEPVAFLDAFGSHIRDDSQIGKLNSPAFLSSLLDWHINAYFRIFEEIETQVDRLDERALTSRTNDRTLVEMAAIRRRISQIRRSLSPHREVFASLARPDFTMLAESASASHFRNLNNRLERAIEAVENARDLLVGSFEIFMSHTAQKTNQVVKVLTLTSVVFFVAGVTASLMSMNFRPPFADAGVKGFWSVVGFIIVMSISILAVAKHRKWV